MAKDEPLVLQTYSRGFTIQLPDDPEERRKEIEEIEALVRSFNRWAVEPHDYD
jgi:hypothetical protein